jgi:hypothetical protein
MSIPVKGKKEMAQVAAIAANNDAEIGDCSPRPWTRSARTA